MIAGSIAYHHSMYTRINKHKHPNRRTHIPDASPHTQHRTSMMIRLQRGAPLALCNDNHSIDDLIEFAHVEAPSPKGQPFIPQPAHVRRVGVAIISHLDRRVLHLPDIDRRVESRRVAEPTRTVQFAQRIRHLRPKMLHTPIRQSLGDRAEHGDEGREAVEREQDIVGEEEVFKRLLLADLPCLVVSAAVVGVEVEDE